MAASDLSAAVRDAMGVLSQSCHSLEALFKKREEDANIAHAERLRLHHV
jgi:hypothetical protein